MCPQDPAPQLGGLHTQIAPAPVAMLRAGHLQEAICPLPAYGAQTLSPIRPWMVPLLSSLTGDLEDDPRSSARASPEAGQTSPQQPAGFASPAGAHGAAHPQPCSLRLSPSLSLAPLALPFLLQATPARSHPTLCMPEPAPTPPPSPGWGGKGHPAPRPPTPALLSSFSCFGTSDPARGLGTVWGGYLSAWLWSFGCGGFPSP